MEQPAARLRRFQTASRHAPQTTPVRIPHCAAPVRNRSPRTGAAQDAYGTAGGCGDGKQ
ncbi:MAG: hypothetical protein LBD24_07395 [Spirochaetaceae bacterium]|nr:hypothetical protein [Spirochaetaceae bacterium]